jgi:hypothetical protein
MISKGKHDCQHLFLQRLFLIGNINHLYINGYSVIYYLKPRATEITSDIKLVFCE